MLCSLYFVREYSYDIYNIIFQKLNFMSSRIAKCNIITCYYEKSTFPRFCNIALVSSYILAVHV